MATRDETKSKLSLLGDKKRSGVSILSNMKVPSRSTVNFGSKSMSRMKVRKQSYGFSAVSGLKNVEMTSQVALEFKRPALIYLNTYQLDPRVRFNPVMVTKLVDEYLDEYMSEYVYNKQEAPELALRMAGQLMRAIKAMKFNRYRIITIVTIGQKRAQSYSNAITFLWDHERDNYVDVNREVRTAFVQVTVFGVYLD